MHHNLWNAKKLTQIHATQERSISYYNSRNIRSWSQSATGLTRCAMRTQALTKQIINALVWYSMYYFYVYTRKWRMLFKKTVWLFDAGLLHWSHRWRKLDIEIKNHLGAFHRARDALYRLFEIDDTTSIDNTDVHNDIPTYRKTKLDFIFYK